MRAGADPLVTPLLWQEMLKWRCRENGIVVRVPPAKRPFITGISTVHKDINQQLLKFQGVIVLAVFKKYRAFFFFFKEHFHGWRE